MDKYIDQNKKLGEGIDGVVYLYKEKTNDKYVAIKCYKLINKVKKYKLLKYNKTTKEYKKNERTRKYLHMEYSLVKSLEHPNIIKMIELITIPTKYNEKIYTVMEYCEENLMDIIDNNNEYDGKGGITKILEYYKQLLIGVKYLHELNIAHYDLKPENLLISNGTTLKISDFCHSHINKINNGEGEVEVSLDFENFYCVESYIPPEFYISHKYVNGQMFDVWSCGIILYLIFTKNYPWEEATEKDQLFYNYLITQNLPWQYSIIKKYNKEMLNFIKFILEPRYKKRADIKEVYSRFNELFN
jgi:serine/threonine protein kinase